MLFRSADIRAKGAQEAYTNAQQQFERDQARALQAQQANVGAQQAAAQLAGQIGTTGLSSSIEAAAKQAAAAAAQQTSDLERMKAQAASEGEKQALQQKIDDLKIDIDKWVTDTEDFSLAHIKELFTAVIILGDDYNDSIETLSEDRKSTRLNSSHPSRSRMPSSA